MNLEDTIRNGKRFYDNAQSLIDLCKVHDYFLNDLLEFDPDWHIMELELFIKNHVRPDFANEYAKDERFTFDNHRTELVVLGCPFYTAKRYAGRYGGDEVCMFHMNNINDVEANALPRDVIVEDVIRSRKPRRKETNRSILLPLNPEVTYESIKTREKIGNKLKIDEQDDSWQRIATVRTRTLNNISQAILTKVGILNSPYKGISDAIIISSDDYSKLADNLTKYLDATNYMYNLLGVGAKAAVLLQENSQSGKKTAIKISRKIIEEYMIIKQIQDFHKGKAENCIKYVKPPIEINPHDITDIRLSVLEIEYIEGRSLEEILKQQFALSPNNVLKYGFDIMKGLVQMRRAGVYHHRDIRPANIIIKSHKDMAIIIDFGIATTDEYALPLDNCRYGGPTDFSSLGQLMYKTATGQNLFAGSKYMEMTVYKKKVKDIRDEVYSDKTGKALQPYLENVDQNIKDEPLKIIIKACLTSKIHDYMTIYQMFQRYGRPHG
jgi:hypothetical protein